MVADVDVEDQPTDFVDARVLVRVPIGTRAVLKVPRAAVVTRSGLDFVRVTTDGGDVRPAGDPRRGRPVTTSRSCPD